MAGLMGHPAEAWGIDYLVVDMPPDDVCSNAEV